ncbi:uncharacterized protein [Elaeis guineensis]|uniref:Uncharacterized protein LOC105032179 n=1 Tax=Elaeis guineensis var. tenera TaxID=51953 RepID=A0A8N4ESE3_ELAGV|nr:uncharacterized protein LOC105032179 [Elaeis guineensis]XP_029116779.1 uncharacterized protein LOC105032179 [Elaeis guineensis]XP_029116780.1 uncharacterized protein LOC105032179 [Elaeis guineensis]XP_029116781.1 uncharacterized protein LOC105032179 [Elaeis guineensis]XP_029116782.1 uncharacterized protein LOC105032179 [Elaeis guineensis]
MTSTFELGNPPQRQQADHQLPSGGSAAASPVAAPPASGRKFSLEEISKYFSLPIAEAASILGVCTRVLKRICRENGIVRWPYRKFLAGKTVEDIKKDTERERTKDLTELPKMANQRTDVSRVMPSSSTFGNQVQSRTLSGTQEALKLQRGVPMPGHVLQSQGNKFSHNNWPNMIQYRGIPTYMDEFINGFPANGLSSVSIKWWGRSSKEDTEKALPEETIKGDNQESCQLSNEISRHMVKDDHPGGPDHSTEDSAAITEPSSSLCSLRRKAVECGRKTLKGGVSKGYTTYKLGKRQRLALFQVFKSSLPDQWMNALS